MVRHFENDPHVGRLGAIEELIGLGGVGVEIAAAGEEAEARLQDALGGVGLGHFLRIGSTSFS